MTPAERLRPLRISRGYASAADAARAMGLKTHVTYRQHESGTREISKKAGERYSRFYNVTFTQLLFGDRLHPQGFVNTVGIVVERGNIAEIPAGSSIPLRVAAPPMPLPSLQALVIGDDTMYPRYQSGDVLYSLEPAAVWGDDAHGRECIVHTQDGRRLVRIVTAQANGLHTLSSYTAAAEPDVQIIRLARVLWVQPGGSPLSS